MGVQPAPLFGAANDHRTKENKGVEFTSRGFFACEITVLSCNAGMCQCAKAKAEETPTAPQNEQDGMV